MNIHTYIYTYIHIHTYTHTHTTIQNSSFSSTNQHSETLRREGNPRWWSKINQIRKQWRHCPGGKLGRTKVSHVGKKAKLLRNQWWWVEAKVRHGGIYRFTHEYIVNAGLTHIYICTHINTITYTLNQTEHKHTYILTTQTHIHTYIQHKHTYILSSAGRGRGSHYPHLLVSLVMRCSACAHWNGISSTRGSMW